MTSMPPGPEAGHYIYDTKKGGIKNQNDIWLIDIVAQFYLLVIDTAEGHDRRAAALGTEARKCLGVFSQINGCNGHQLRRCHRACPAPSVQSYFDHEIYPRILAAFFRNLSFLIFYVN